MGDTSSQPSSAEDTLQPPSANRSDKLTYPLDQHWTERQWQSLVSRCHVSLYDVVHALGILAPGKECPVAMGVWRFGDATLDALSVAVSKIVKEVAARFHGDDLSTALVAAAANSNYLDDEIGGLLDRFGDEVWGMDGGMREGCMVRLVYEDDVDRRLIYLHLGQWIFLKVFNILREQRRKKNPKSGKRKRVPQEAVSSKRAKVQPAAFVGEVTGEGNVEELDGDSMRSNVVMGTHGTQLAYSQTAPNEQANPSKQATLNKQAVPSIQTTSDDTVDYTAKPSQLELLLLGAKMTAGPHSMRPPINTLNTDQTQSQEPLDLADSINDETSSIDSKSIPKASSPPIEAPPSNTPPLDILLKKHFLRTNPGYLDEATLLSYLSYAWATEPSMFCKQASHQIPFGSVLSAWIAWRRNAIRVKGYITALPSAPETEWVYRAGLCTELRRLREEFLEMTVEVNPRTMEAKNVICTALGNVMGLTAKKDMEVMRLVRERICGVDVELAGLERDPQLDGDDGGD